jgi:hypothetical protein
MDVAECTADDTQQHEAANTSDVASVSDGSLNSVGDRVHHRVHGRHRVGHLYLGVGCRDSGESPMNSFFWHSVSAV